MTRRTRGVVTILSVASLAILALLSTGCLRAEVGGKLTAFDFDPGDRFGRSVSMSGDILVVGSPRDVHAGVFSGSVYVFGRSGVTWELQTKLISDDAEAGDHFGSSVAISGDTIVCWSRG